MPRLPASVFFSLLVPPLPPTAAGRVARAGLYFLGSALSCSYLYSLWGVVGPLAAGLILAALSEAAVWPSRGGLRLVPRVAVGLLLAAHAMTLYVTGSFGFLLGWSVDWPWRVAVVLLAAGSLATAVRPLGQVVIPALIPLGFGLSLCLAGWQREDGVVRCDDYFEARSQAGVELAVPVSVDLATCQQGLRLKTPRYARNVWEAPEGGRFIVTTQPGIDRLWPPGTPVSDPIQGSICEAFEGQPVHACVGVGKAQRLLESEEHDRLFVPTWGAGARGQKGHVYAIPRRGELRVIDQISVAAPIGEGFYDPETDLLTLFDDNFSQINTVRASDLALQPPRPMALCPGETRYDQERGEGLLCLGSGPILTYEGRAFTAVAVSGRPFRARLLGSSDQTWWSWLSLSWGCDLDLPERTAYAAIPTTGHVTELDYDSGEVRGRHFVSLGIRFLLYDASRRWVFVNDFLRGQLIALDAVTWEEQTRWFIGRFARHISLSRDGRHVLAATNLGVVRVTLPVPPEG